LVDASFVEPYFSKFDWPKRKRTGAYRVGNKQEEKAMIISASYKTDIPTFFGEWFINRLRAGYCKTLHP
jgi:hypothetical protein